MKRCVSLLLSLSLVATTFVFAVIPAYAASPYDADWIPPVPDFITQITNGFRFGGLYSPSSPDNEVNVWINNIMADEKAVFLYLLDQDVYNKVKEEQGSEYDRQFSLYIVSPNKKADGSYYDLGGFEHTGGPQHFERMSKPSPMTYMCLDNPHSFVKAVYDDKSGKLVLQPNVSHLPGGAGSVIRFTYVLAVGNGSCLSWVNSDTLQVVNGRFAEKSEVYPGFAQVSGKDFGVGTVYHQVVNGKAVDHWRDYNWWLGIDGGPIPSYNPNLDLDQDTDGDGEPDINVDTDGDGNPDINIDTDGDGEPDINIDTDGDGRPDINIDTDGDGKPDINIDTDGDGKPDINIDTDGDRKPDVNIDTDGDKKPDINVDTDGDGKPDTNIDIDGDGKPDINTKPGGGDSSGSSSGGSSSGGGDSGSGSSGGSSSGGGDSGDGDGPDGPGSGGGSSSDKGGPPDTWFSPDVDLPLDPWEFFDPFKPQTPPIDWDDDYDPRKPGDPIYDGYDPFAVFNNLLKEMFGG